MIELLKLCGFEAHEIGSELSRVEKAFNRLGITNEDIERGKQRLPQYYDMELKGVRKIWRGIIRELVNLLLAKEEGKTKFIYGYMTPNFQTIGSALVSNSNEVCAAYLSHHFQAVMGCLFDKIVPILEAAEAKWMKSGVVAHCGNVKALVGIFALDFIPKPDLIITSGALCETSSKTLDLLHELEDIPIYCSSTCQDRGLREGPNATKRITDLSAKSMRRFMRSVQEVVGFEITNDMLHEAFEARSRLDSAIGKLRNLIANSDPLALSHTHESLLVHLNSVSLSTESLLSATDAINTLYEELDERVHKGLGVVEKGAPRVLAILPAHYTDPRQEHLVSELGLAIVATDVNLSTSDVGGSKDPCELLSMHLQRSMYNPPARRIPLIIEECKRLNVDGLLDRFHVGCRTVAGDAFMIKNAVTKDLGIPVLLLERDDFDSRSYNHNLFKKQLEVFRTMMVERSTKTRSSLFHGPQ
jgi:benzoyl-CoA reductase/2-hydroxyglutaryl-CoA dehydratase subunit BcrC/BadD/HgdB